MKLLLYPLFGISGYGHANQHYCLPQTQLCIHSRAFPYQSDGRFIKLPTQKDPLKIGDFTPQSYEGKIYLRKIAGDNYHYDEYEVVHDGFGNKPCFLYAKEVKKIPFQLNGRVEDRMFEENYAIAYLNMLPDDIKILTMLQS